jgi:hypothetical protein
MSTLKRSRRRELVLTPSFAKVIKAKLSNAISIGKANPKPSAGTAGGSSSSVS